MQIASALDAGGGFFEGLSLTPAELARLRGHIRRQFLHRIAQAAPQHRDAFGSIELDRYHELADLVDHKALWQTVFRVLDRDAVEDIRTMSLFRPLEQEFGEFDIVDGESVGRENVIWRIVRPRQFTDVGPLHADAWFTELGHGITPPNAKRLKVWIAVYGEPGLQVVENSHKRSWPYHGEWRDGFVKPRIDVEEQEVDRRLLMTEPGQAVVFHDRLLHRGLPGVLSTRISLELMIMLRNRF